MTKRADAWMPLYIGDYMADTMHLSRSDHGGYFLLIMAYWRNGKPLRDDDRYLAGITRSSAHEWRKLRPVMAEFFHIEDGLWRHKRIDAELTKSRNISEIRAEVGARGGRPKSNKNNDVTKPIAEPIAIQLGKQTETPSPSPTTNVVEITKVISPSNPRLRDQVFGDDFDFWWRAVPRKVGKIAAKAAYAKARRKHGATADELLDGIRSYADAVRSNGTAEQYIAHPSAWLNAGRWQDEEGIDNGHARRDVPTRDFTEEEIWAALRERESGMAR